MSDLRGIMREAQVRLPLYLWRDSSDRDRKIHEKPSFVRERNADRR
jgi:hypothetical protein